MDTKPHTNTPKDDLWTSGQMLDIIFDTHWKDFVEFAEKCLNADISFIEDECMYEIKMKHEWVPYTGHYDKKWYDIKLDNGDIIEQCYPNAGWFHSENFGTFREERVKALKISDMHPLGDPQI